MLSTFWIVFITVLICEIANFILFVLIVIAFGAGQRAAKEKEEESKRLREQSN